jgi:hypothetical protein
MGIVVVARLTAETPGVVAVTMMSTFRSTSYAANSVSWSYLPPSSERGKLGPERIITRGLRHNGAQTQITDPIELARLLRRRGKRPRRRTAEKPDKLPPPHQHHPRPDGLYGSIVSPAGGLLYMKLNAGGIGQKRSIGISDLLPELPSEIVRSDRHFVRWPTP